MSARKTMGACERPSTTAALAPLEALPKGLLQNCFTGGPATHSQKNSGASLSSVEVRKTKELFSPNLGI